MLLAALLVVTPASAAEPSVPFDTYTLDNGLRVVLSEDHSVPYVWVDVWYDVGSKDEQPGRSGFAHLFEHLMFQGSAHADDDYFQPLQKNGGQVNGNTTLDRTNYFEGVPSRYLPLALFLESDRMGWLDDVLSPQKFDNQRDVVRNERRQRYETPPYGEAWPKLLESVWPEGHPYHIATIGKHEDLQAATLPDAVDFFNRWYLPNNAILSVVGDFDATQAKELVRTYFADVPRGPDPPRTAPPPYRLTEQKVVRVEKDVPFPKVWVAWVTPPILKPGDAELDLYASWLTGGVDAPLYKALVRDQQVAQDVSAYQQSAQLGSMFIIEATAARGHTVEELQASIDAVLTDAMAHPMTDEDLEIARTSYEVGFWGSLSTIAGKATQLVQYTSLTGDPGYLAKDLARYRDATTASIAAEVQADLPLDRRVILQFVPGKK
jgi:zinc protease